MVGAAVELVDVVEGFQAFRSGAVAAVDDEALRLKQPRRISPSPRGRTERMAVLILIWTCRTPRFRAAPRPPGN
jgi:hypothetical protein